jgi:hypothetical protein
LAPSCATGPLPLLVDGWGAPGYPARAPCWGERRRGSGCRPQPQPHRRGGGGLLDVGFDSTPLIAECGAE